MLVVLPDCFTDTDRPGRERGSISVLFCGNSLGVWGFRGEVKAGDTVEGLVVGEAVEVDFNGLGRIKLWRRVAPGTCCVVPR